MDESLESIVDFVHSTRFEALPSEVRRKATGILVDTLGCAVGGRDCRAASIARALAGVPAAGNEGAVIGSQDPCPADLAAFWNTSMIRYLDFNDHLVSGHASDMLGALFAVAGIEDVTGADMLTAITIAYEVHSRLVVNMHALQTIDRAYSITVSATAGLCHLLRLGREETRNAISMSITSGVCLRAARAGALSDFKGVASAVGTQFAVFATLLAKGGLTGPSEPLSGRHGLVELVSGEAGPMPLEPFLDWNILKTCQKYWPVAYGMQPAVWAALKLREEVGPAEVRSVVLHAAPFAWFETGSDPEKWNPKTRETADHSLPYAFARALEVGTIDQAAFETSAFTRKETIELMRRIEVIPDPSRGPQTSDFVGIRAELTTTAGVTHVVSIDSPRGHHDNPMTDDEISKKTRLLVEPVLHERTEEAIQMAWDAESLGSFRALLDEFAVRPSA